MVEISSSASFQPLPSYKMVVGLNRPTCHRRTRVGDDTSHPPTHPTTHIPTPTLLLFRIGKKKKYNGRVITEDIFRSSHLSLSTARFWFPLFISLSFSPSPLSRISLPLSPVYIFLLSLWLPTPPLSPAEKKDNRNGSLLLLLNQRWQDQRWISRWRPSGGDRGGRGCVGVGGGGGAVLVAGLQDVAGGGAAAF